MGVDCAAVTECNALEGAEPAIPLHAALHLATASKLSQLIGANGAVPLLQHGVLLAVAFSSRCTCLDARMAALPAERHCQPRDFQSKI